MIFALLLNDYRAYAVAPKYENFSFNEYTTYINTKGALY